MRVEDQIPLLVELQDVDNRVKIKLANPEVHAVVTHDVIGQIMVACCMQPGLASVLEAVMSFEGSELYVQAWPELVGRRFGDILCVFDDATVLGVVADGAGRTGGGAGYTRDIGGAVNPGLRLNPDDEYVLEAGDALIVLADDDDSYAVNPRALAQLDNSAKADPEGTAAIKWESFFRMVSQSTFSLFLHFCIVVLISVLKRHSSMNPT